VFRHLEDTLLDILVTFLAGFGAYLLAEHVHASGVLAAVACGLVLGRQQHAAFTARTRVEAAAVWDFVEFVLTALVFVLIGLQLRDLLGRLDAYDSWRLAGLGCAVSATLIASRFGWVFVTTWLPRALSRRLRARDPMPPWSHSLLVSWAGMRGVVSLAAALALPADFPERDIIVFLAFCAILATLVLQGTTLGVLIHRLGIGAAAGGRPIASSEAMAMRQEAAEAAIDVLSDKAGETEHGDVADELMHEMRDRARRAETVRRDPDGASPRLDARQHLRLAAIDAARTRLMADRRDALDADALAAMVAELDMEEEQIRIALGER
jgi:CPA1 family monovalent cation:H+ antiporter